MACIRSSGMRWNGEAGSMLRIIRASTGLHIYAYIMVRGSVIEQQRHIKTVGAFGQLAVFFIKRVDNLLGNHLWFINGVIKLGTNRWPNVHGFIAVVLNNRSDSLIVYKILRFYSIFAIVTIV